MRTLRFGRSQWAFSFWIKLFSYVLRNVFHWIDFGQKFRFNIYIYMFCQRQHLKRNSKIKLHSQLIAIRLHLHLRSCVLGSCSWHVCWVVDPSKSKTACTQPAMISPKLRWWQPLWWWLYSGFRICIRNVDKTLALFLWFWGQHGAESHHHSYCNEKTQSKNVDNLSKWKL